MDKKYSTSIWFFVVVAISLLPIQSAFAQNKGVFGYWKTINKDTGKPEAIFRLWEDQGKLVGRIVKVFLKPGEKMPLCSDCTGAQRNKPRLGLMGLWGFVRDDGSDIKWVDGKILNPEDGKVYNSQIDLSEDGKKLNVYGYIRLLVKIGGTSVWERPTAEEMKDVKL